MALFKLLPTLDFNGAQLTLFTVASYGIVRVPFVKTATQCWNDLWLSYIVFYLVIHVTVSLQVV